MKKTINNLKKVYSYGKKYKKNLIIFLFVSIVTIAINIAYPIFSAKGIVALTAGVFDQIIIATLICFGMAFLSDFTRVVSRINTQVFFRGTTKDLQLAAAKEILKIELTSIDENGSGTFIQRINNDTDEMSKIFTQGISYLTGITADIGIYVAVFIYSKVVFCYVLICSVILICLYLLEAKKVTEKDKKYRQQKDRTNSLIGELVRGIRDIKMLYAKESFIKEIDKNIDALTTSQFEMRNTETNYDWIIDIAFDTFETVLIFLLVYLLFKGNIVVATALILYNYRYRVFGNLMYNLGELIQETKRFNLSCERVFSVLDDKEFKKEKFGNKKIEKIKGNFEFKNVSFGYNDVKVLNDMSFKVNANETVAFVGKSGVGKTTIFSLLCKLYDVESGSILLDGHNLKDLDEKSIRNNITIISQNPYIFNLSIKDNFKLVKANVTDKEIKQACKLSCLDEFIESLPDGYNTIVGEGGVTLSGGQRQRLAIARALVQNTKIILFDEATSALDNETQEYIQQAIDNMKDKYTILIIAHRLSTIINADRIMVIDDGKVIATGTHKELLTKSKIYKRLYENEILNN